MTNAIKKVVAVAVVALVALGATVSVNAQSTGNLAFFMNLGLDQATAQMLVDALGGGNTTNTGSSSVNYYRVMKRGVTGADVTSLQQYLTSQGFTTYADGVYGPATEASVRMWQQSKNLFADGIFGPMSYNASKTGSVVTNNNNSTFTLEQFANLGTGNELTVAEFDVESLDDSDIEQGQEDVVLAEVTYEGEDSAGLVSRIDVLWLPGDSNTDTDPSKVFDKLYLEIDGDIVKTISDADDEGSYNDNLYIGTDVTSTSCTTGGNCAASDELYATRFSGINEILEADEEYTIRVLGDVQSGAEVGDEWTAAFAGTSVVITDESGFVVNTGAATDTGNVVTITSEGAELELSVSGAGDLDAQVLLVDDAVKKTHTVMIAEVEHEDGREDIEIQEVDVTVNTGTANVADVISEITLIIGGESVDGTLTNGASTSATANFDFDRDDVIIEQGDTVDFEFEIQFKVEDGSVNNYSEGETIQVVLDANDIVAKGDDSNETLTASQLNGANTGEEHVLYTEGIQMSDFTFEETSTTIDGDDNDVVTLEIGFDVTAVGTTVYVMDEVTETGNGTGSTATAPSNTEGIGYHIQHTGGTYTSSSATFVSTADQPAGNGHGNFVVDNGETEEFTIEVNIQNGATSLLDNQSLRMILGGLNWSTADQATGSYVHTLGLSQNMGGYQYMAN